MQFDALIFDLDGTLWNSSETVAASWRHTIASGYEPLIQPDGDMIRGLMGMTEAQIRESVFGVYGEKAAEVCAACLDGEPAYIREHGAMLFPGLEEMLSTLSESYPLFLVSNCQSGYIESFLYCSGMGRYIKAHTCEGDTGMGKADNIRLIMEQNGVKSAVYIGDTASDERSAAAAGCPFIHAAYGFGTALSPVAVAKRLDEIPEIIRTLTEEN